MLVRVARRMVSVRGKRKIRASERASEISTEESACEDWFGSARILARGTGRYPRDKGSKRPLKRRHVRDVGESARNNGGIDGDPPARAWRKHAPPLHSLYRYLEREF